MRTAILTEGKLFFDMALDIIKKLKGGRIHYREGANSLELAFECT